MKNTIVHSHYLLIAALAVLVSINYGAAQGTAFTYQGQLNTASGPANGNYDLTFSLYNASTGGSQTGNTLTDLAVGITNGLFTTSVDFGAVYNGTSYWLQIGVRTNGASTFTPLSPRQELTPTPYAITAQNVTGTIPLAQLPSTVVTNNETGVVLSSMTVNGILNLPTPATIDFDGTTLLRADGNFNFYAGQGAGVLTLGEYDNTGIGAYALQGNTEGSYNTAVGAEALEYSTSGENNTAVGNYALSANMNGSQNEAVGDEALAANTSGGNNVAMGDESLFSNTSGSDNVAIGHEAMQNATVDSGVVAIGYQALQYDSGSGGFLSIGSANEAVGYQALQTNTTGSANTAIGYQTLFENRTGYQNTAIGIWALLGNVNGYNNTANGSYALGGNTSGYQNTANGAFALEANATGNNNTADGEGALSANASGSFNTADGAGALAGESGASGGGNTASGAATLANLTTGYNNVAAGYQALLTNTVGYDNVAIGVATFQINGQGHQNTAVGTYDFQNLTSGSGNVGLGYYAGNSLVSGNNNIYIGNPGASTESGIIRIGTPGTQTGAYLAGSLWLDGNDTLNGLTYMTSGLNGVPGGAGPFLFGYNGGSLGTSDPNLPALSWDYNGNVWVSNGLSTATLTIRGGADLAEPFKIAAGKTAVPQGAVLVIDDQNPGQLKLTDQPYDTRVAGVVSGANGINPGIQMHQQGLLDGGRNVALSGRVYVQADTSNGAIKPGDLLTTSSLPGRAMRVSDHVRAQGAILGKAMSALNEGQGMVLVLVTLQ
jgi:hypothetical protein